MITITRPDDWHLHVRDGEITAMVLPETAKVFARALIMPNLKPPVSNAKLAIDYQNRLRSHLGQSPPQTTFQPKMAIYLTPHTTAEDINLAAQHADILAVKWYPAGATTHSADGVSVDHFQSPAMQTILSALVANNLPLCIHGEVVEGDVDIFDRERVFLEKVLLPLVRAWPKLRIVLEHISSRHAVDFVMTHAKTHPLAATITAHHLAFDRNAMLVGGIRPHYYCLPILKRLVDRQALIRAAISGNPAFFLGTDSAPHTQSTKEASCGCAGAYTAPVAMPLYAQVFEAASALDKLNDFSSKFGADFYQQPMNRERLALKRQSWQVPQRYQHKDINIVPFLAGETLNWQVEHVG